jgi:hydroxyacylglutathione hydrolase
LTIEPENKALLARAAAVDKLVAEKKLTVPSTMADEREANPFLRADVPEVAASVGLSGKQPAEVFAEIRARKNNF